MGGRGASFGGGKSSASGSITINGGTIEFEGNLVYGGDDKTLSAGARKAIEAWEAKRRQSKIEYAYAVDEYGNPVGVEKKGGKHSVRTPYAFHNTTGGTFTHNHPRDDTEVLGGTFSWEDLTSFANGKSTTTRATAKEGTYSISKTANFDFAGFRRFTATVKNNAKSAYDSATKKLYGKYQSGDISRTDYIKALSKSFNTYLVNLHNGYASGQKTYGYTYTLERNK